MPIHGKHFPLIAALSFAVYGGATKAAVHMVMVSKEEFLKRAARLVS